MKKRKLRAACLAMACVLLCCSCGDKGGTIIAKGTPEEVAENPVSYTGKYIEAMLRK